MDSQQQTTFSVNIKTLSKLFKDIDFKLLTILEFGSGELSELILKQNPRILISYSHDINIPYPESQKLILRYKDLAAESFKWLKNGKCGVICVPQVDSIQRVSEIIQNNGIQNFLVVVPKSKAGLFDGKVVGEVKATDFFPARKGKHVVLHKGFTTKNK